MTAPRDRMTLRRAAELAASLRTSVICAHQFNASEGCPGPNYPYLVGCLGVTLEHLVRDLAGREAAGLVRTALRYEPTAAELAMGPERLREHCQPAALHRPQRPRRATTEAAPCSHA